MRDSLDSISPTATRELLRADQRPRSSAGRSSDSGRKNTSRSDRVLRVGRAERARRRVRRGGWSATLSATWSRSRGAGALSIRALSAARSSRCRRFSHRALAMVLAMSALSFAGAARAGAAPAGATVRVPATIDATGASDVSAPLATFLGSVPDGATVVFPARGRYRVEQSLVLRQRHGLTILGNGSTVFATTRVPRDRSQWVLINSSRIVFRNLVVVGAHKNAGTTKDAYVENLETQHGFRFEAVQDVELDHVTVTNVFGDFVYVGRNLNRKPSERVWIHDSTFARNGRQGIAVSDASGVVIERNRFAETRRSVVDLEPNTRSWKVKGVFILGNVVGPGRLLFVASHGGGPVDDVVISRNQLRGHTLTIDVLSPPGQRRANWVITDNVSDAPLHNRAVRLIGVDGVIVRGNRQPVTGGQPALIVSDTCGAQLEGNDFGTGKVQQKGQACAAQVQVPTPPRIIGRDPSGAPPTTVPVRPPPTTAHRPPASTSSTTIAPARGTGGGGGGDGWIVWVLVGVAVAAAGSAGIVWWRRARRSPDAGGEESP